MFSVPGWGVSPASLVQEKPTPKANSRSASSDLTSVAKKRKHGHSHGEQTSKISGSELEKLWDQHNGSKNITGASSTVSQKGRGDKHQKNHLEVKSDGPNAGKGRGQQEGIHGREKKHTQQAQREPQPGRTLQTASAQDRSTKSPRDQKPVHVKQQHIDGHSQNQGQGKHATSATSSVAQAVVNSLPPAPPTTKLTPLQEKMRSKLTSARFRHLNETLYTTSSAAALDLFTNSPDLFAEYHAGFSQQVKDSWPQNPVDGYIRSIKTRGKIPVTSSSISSTENIRTRNLPLPRRKTNSCTIADLGCGDAPLARGCQSEIKALTLKFHNYDLYPANTHVTKADIAQLPLRDGEADIAIFCLSLMGTNWLSFVDEAWRILRGDGKGEVWVSEVKSRFGRVKRARGHVVENSVGKRRKVPKRSRTGIGGNSDDELDGLPDEEVLVEDATTAEGGAGDETDISGFVSVFSRRGFVLRDDSVDKSNKMFVSMVFVKAGVPTAGKHKGLKWNGHEYQKIHDGKMRFVAGQARAGKRGGGGDDEELSLEDEAKVLKPCVYKTR